MSKSLEELKTELRADFGKITCWQWLCQDRNATTEQAQVAVAEEVLAMPRMDNVAAAQTYWSRLQGKKTGNIKDLLAGRFGAADAATAHKGTMATVGHGHDAGIVAGPSHDRVGGHPIRSTCDLERVRDLSRTLISQQRAKMLGDEILRDLDTGYISDETYRRLSRWCNPKHPEPKAQPIALELSQELFGHVIARMP